MCVRPELVNRERTDDDEEEAEAEKEGGDVAGIDRR